MATHTESLSQIERLVDHFQKHKDRFQDPKYNEEQVRVEFITPMFRALGWDVENSLHVVHEDRVTMQGERGVKHPDYGFRTGQDVRFYVEAKKPSVDLSRESDPAYQVRRYGWSKKLPLSVLTDFEEFTIYNCLQKPDLADGSHIARLRHIKYEDYLNEWDFLYGLFSYEAVLDGALERYVDEEKLRGTITVDEAFLREMESWRETLAKDIAHNNPSLTRRQLNMAVQRTIDRLVFLRIAEDRNIEPYGRLLRAAMTGGGVYQGLTQLYRQADDKYNSGLFHFTEDTHSDEGDPVSLKMAVSDAALQGIIKNLYYPNSPYEFSVLPADILGQVYERFLGSVIVLEGGSAQIEEKPEVRKAGGVYYTPTYIVDYIVQNTVGKLLEGKNPNQVADLRILDPACGSGSFLIGAYQYLLDWHLDYYTTLINENPKSTYRNRVRESSDPAIAWTLTTDEKKRILLNNIYGVDLDQQAVEVTKLSLLLKMLENENAASTTQYALMRTDDALLPDLANNIKWGNSLIGSDFYSGQQMSLFDDEEIYRVRAFDWDVEFADIMQRGGFDAVIGNPPYIRIQNMKEYAPETVPYYGSNYVAASRGNYDIYVVFIEKGLQLLNPKGRLGYIVPHKFFNAKYGEPIRGLIAQGRNISHIVHFGHQQIFDGATTYTCLLFLTNESCSGFRFCPVEDLHKWRLGYSSDTSRIDSKNVTLQDWNFIGGKRGELFTRLSSMPTKMDVVADRIAQGIRTSANPVYVVEIVDNEGDITKALSEQLEKVVSLDTANLTYFLKGREIKPYQIAHNNLAVIIPYALDMQGVVFMDESVMSEQYPNTYAYLLENKISLENRERGRMRTKEWYAFVYPKNLDVMNVSKILVPDIANRASFALDEKGQYAFTSGYGITLKPETLENIKYVLGLLNSKVLDFYFKQISTTIRGGYFRYFTQYIEQLPIRTIDFNNPNDVAKHDRMVSLVQSMLDLHKQLSDASGAAKGVIEQQIAHTDHQIDQLVYDLYDLTVEEIAIVKGRA